MAEPAPPIRCLVGWTFQNGQVRVRKDLLSLDDAAILHRLGYVVLVDPSDEVAYYDWLRTYEQPKWWRF